MAEDLLHHPRAITHGMTRMWVLAEGATERVHVPDAEDQVAPAFGGEFGGGGETPGRGKARSGGRPRWRTPRILLEYQP